MWRGTLWVAGFAVLSLSLSASAGVDINLGFGSLPSAQGWTYSGSHPEASTMQLSGGVLSYNTMGWGQQDAFAYYSVNSPSWASSFVLNITMKTTDMEEWWRPYPFAAAVGIGNDNYWMGLSIAPSYVAVDLTAHTPATVLLNNVDNHSAFHDYELQGTFGVDWKLSRDGGFVASGVWTPITAGNGFWFGDISNGSNAAVSISRFSLQSPVPEPAGLSLLGALGAFACFKRRRSI